MHQVDCNTVTNTQCPPQACWKLHVQKRRYFTKGAFIELLRYNKGSNIYILYELVCLFILSIAYYVAKHNDCAFSLQMCLHLEYDVL